MTSPYIQNSKDWKIREIVVHFLEAKSTFETHIRPLGDGKIISYGILRNICDLLWEIKEGHHLIFKKIIDPKKRTFEKANKFTPTEGEINFMNDAGLLFHNVMIARELKYMLDYYKEDSSDYLHTKKSFERTIKRIERLFNQGIKALQTMLKSHKNNIYLITFFLENQKFCTKQLKIDLESLLKLLTVDDGLEKAYLTAAEYYVSSGWYDKAELMCKQSLKLNPQNSRAKSLMESL